MIHLIFIGGFMNIRKRGKRYSPEFRLETAQLVALQGYSIREASDAMGAGKSTVDKWVRQLCEEQLGATAANLMTDDQRKILALEKKIRRVEEEKDILKKSCSSSRQLFRSVFRESIRDHRIQTSSKTL